MEKSCLEAISHYAHGVTAREPQDRLLHALVAVESLLLRDQNEPVQSHLGYRIAILTNSKLEERRKAKKDFIKGYNLRSRFVHHGAKPNDIEMANRILLLCWSDIIKIIRLTERFNSKQMLLNSLEDNMLGFQ